MLSHPNPHSRVAPILFQLSSHSANSLDVISALPREVCPMAISSAVSYVIAYVLMFDGHDGTLVCIGWVVSGVTVGFVVWLTWLVLFSLAR